VCYNIEKVYNKVELNNLSRMAPPNNNGREENRTTMIKIDAPYNPMGCMFCVSMFNFEILKYFSFFHFFLIIGAFDICLDRGIQHTPF
jgi:hypothetical protein